MLMQRRMQKKWQTITLMQNYNVDWEDAFFRKHGSSQKL